jgi:GntR family transcriptional regulator/MocR family aminotransferase
MSLSVTYLPEHEINAVMEKAPLISMDPHRVIYVGTFSKTLFPALRIGFVILPPCLKKQWNHLRTHTDVQNPPVEQIALAEFLHTRKFDRHIQKMRRIYGQRRQVLLESLKAASGNGWTAYGDKAGLHVAINFHERVFDSCFKQNCLRKGINIVPVESHCITKGVYPGMLLMGYGHLEPDEIRHGVSLLMDMVKW